MITFTTLRDYDPDSNHCDYVPMENGYVIVFISYYDMMARKFRVLPKKSDHIPSSAQLECTIMLEDERNLIIKGSVKKISKNSSSTYYFTNQRMKKETPYSLTQYYHDEKKLSMNMGDRFVFSFSYSPDHGLFLNKKKQNGETRRFYELLPPFSFDLKPN